MMPPPTFCFNFPQHLEEQKRAFDHGKSCLITATLAHYGLGGGEGWLRNPEAQKRETEEKKYGEKNEREKDTDKPVTDRQSETHTGIK